MVLKLHEWLLIGAAVLVDQITKAIAWAHQPNNALFQLARNTGAGFGILQDNNLLLLVISLLVFALVLWKLVPQSKGHERYAYLGLLAGILGNCIDRVARGFVVDFISIGSFPIFNIADSLITVSVISLVFLGLKESTRKKR